MLVTSHTKPTRPSLPELQGRPYGASTDSLDGAVDRDVLGSLEPQHQTASTIRSVRSNGSAVPTLERVRREESNHSIGSHSQTSSGQVSKHKIKNIFGPDRLCNIFK